jgi:hypothetical protein
MDRGAIETDRASHNDNSSVESWPLTGWTCCSGRRFRGCILQPNSRSAGLRKDCQPFVGALAAEGSAPFCPWDPGCAFGSRSIGELRCRAVRVDARASLARTRSYPMKSALSSDGPGRARGRSGAQDGLRLTRSGRDPMGHDRHKRFWVAAQHTPGDTPDQGRVRTITRPVVFLTVIATSACRLPPAQGVSPRDPNRWVSSGFSMRRGGPLATTLHPSQWSSTSRSISRLTTG